MKKSHLVLIFSLIFLAGLSFCFVPAFSVLVISNRKNLKEVYYSTAAYKNGFVISYTHSVNKGRVHDYYTCQSDGSLFLDKTVFVSYGAGIPEPEETPGAVFSVTPQGYEISNLQRKVPRLIMAVGIVANHSIVFDADYDFLSSENKGKNGNNSKAKEIFLTDLFPPQTSIILETSKASVFELLLHKIKKSQVL